MLRQMLSVAIAASFAFLCACSGGAQNGASIVPQSATVSNAARHHRLAPGFTEYHVPSGVSPRYVAVTSDNTVWFGNGVNIGDPTTREIFGRLHGGAVTMMQLPAASQNVLMGFATAYGKGVWGVAVDDTIDEGQDYLANGTAAGKVPALQPDTDDNQYWAMAAGPDGRLWYAHCLQACGEFPAGGVLSSRNSDLSTGPSFTFSNYYFAVGIAAGTDGNLYASVHYGGPPGPHDSYVYKMSTAGALLAQVLLPDGSSPEGLTAGSDGNVWVTEPGIDSIARVTPGGTVTQFPLPTPNAQPQQIVGADDGALWFTEMGANAIGRLTTTGSLTQYTIPTPNSQPFGIASAGRCPGVHATVWFSEFAAGKIGRLRV